MQAPDARRPTILIVDDDRTVHAIIARALTEFAGTIVHAYDGLEGLRLARELRPELIFTDALLPGLDGRELTRMLKSDPEGSRQRVVVMTSLYKGLRYRNEALDVFHADEYLEKPLTASLLRALAAAIPAAHITPAADDEPSMVTS